MLFTYSSEALLPDAGLDRGCRIVVCVTREVGERFNWMLGLWASEA